MFDQPPPRERGSDVDDDDVDGNEEFEHVHVVRRCSIETFYRVVVPALRQISEKYENRENEETRRLLEVEGEDVVARTEVSPAKSARYASTRV